MFLIITFFGDYLLWVILLTGILFGPRPYLSSGFALAVSWLVKNLYYLPRPFILSGQPPLLRYLSDGSLPSIHTAVAVAFAVSIFLLHRRWGLVFLVLALLVASGRVLGGVHSYFDVFAGAFIGGLSALISKSFCGIDSCHSQC